MLATEETTAESCSYELCSSSSFGKAVAARVLRTNQVFLRRAVADGDLPVYTLNPNCEHPKLRVSMKEVAVWIRTQRVVPKGTGGYAGAGRAEFTRRDALMVLLSFGSADIRGVPEYVMAVSEHVKLNKPRVTPPAC